MIESGTLSYRTQVFFNGTFSSNLIISSLNFTNPVIFPMNFIQSEAYSNTNAIISISVNGTIIGSLTFYSGNTFGAFQSSEDININIGDVMTFTVISGENIYNGEVYISITLNGSVYIAPILFTYIPNVFTYDANNFIVSGNVYPPNTQLCLGFSSNNIDPPTSYVTATTTGENWTATLSGGSFTVGTETYIWAEFISDESIYKICPFSPQALSISITGIYDGSFTSGFISTANQNDTITILGNVVIAGNAVQVALSTSNTLLPYSDFVYATVNGSSWTANLTLSSVGTYYVWAEQTNNPNIYAVSSPIVVSSAVTYSITNITVADWYENYGFVLGATPLQTANGNSSFTSQPIEFAYSTSTSQDDVFTTWSAIPYVTYNFSFSQYRVGLAVVPSTSPCYLLIRFVNFPSIYTIGGPYTLYNYVAPGIPAVQATSVSGNNTIYIEDGGGGEIGVSGVHEFYSDTIPALIQDFYDPTNVGTFTCYEVTSSGTIVSQFPAMFSQNGFIETTNITSIFVNSSGATLDSTATSLTTSYTDSFGNSITLQPITIT